MTPAIGVCAKTENQQIGAYMKPKTGPFPDISSADSDA
jgi:hypothetical protein